MKLNVEQRIIMDKFKPRPYQLDFIISMENKGIKKAVAVWPRRCFSPDTDILMFNGSVKKASDIEVGDRILSHNGNQVEEDIVKDVWKTEQKETIRIKSGKFLEVNTSFDHKFSTINPKTQNTKWKKASELTTGSNLMSYAGFNYGSKSNPELAEFIGYMSSDGSLSSCGQPSFTNIDTEIIDRVEFLAKKIFNVHVRRDKSKGKNAVTLGFVRKIKNNSDYFVNPIKEFFKENNQCIQKFKRPLNPLIWEMDFKSVKRFLAGVISGDGNLYIHKKGFISKDRNRSVPPAIELTISCGINDQYGWDIYWLIRKYGIIPNIPYKEKNNNWKIKITNSSGIYKILNDNYIYGKDESRKKILDILSNCKKDRLIIKDCYKSRANKFKKSSKKELIDIETTKNHNFFANGYLVHNSGKDICAWNILIRAAIREPGSYIYCLPTFSQCRRVILSSKLEDNSGMSFMDFIPKDLISSFNKSEMAIHLINGSIINLVGSDNADRLVGMAAKGIVISEAALANPYAISYLTPMINSSNGFIILVSTPRGHNRFWELYNVAKRSSDWFVSKLTVEDTCHIPVEKIEADIRSGIISKELAEQEYFTSFSSQNQGSYYGKYLDKMILNDQIGIVPYEPSLETFAFFDLGINDMTAIIFAQFTSQTIRIIDFYQNHSEGLEHYVNYVKNKDYGKVKLFMPHDIKVRELSSGMSRLDKLRGMGVEVDVVPNIPINDGIEAVRTILPKTFIDAKKCEKLIRAIENYTKEYDEVNKVYKNRPNHNFHSHANDALRYLSVSYKKVSHVGMSQEDIDTIYNKAVYGYDSNLPEMFR